MVESEEGVGWQWTMGNRAAALPAMLGSSHVSERKRIKTSAGLLGSVVYQVMYHRWAQDSLGRVERCHQKTFLVSDWGKLTGSGLYKPAQAHSYGGRHPGTTLTRPENTCRFPREADAVEEEHRRSCSAPAWQPCWHVSVANKYGYACPPPPLPVACPVVRQFNCR